MQEHPEVENDVMPEAEPPVAESGTGDATTDSHEQGDEKVTISKREYWAIKDAREREKKLSAEMERLKAQTESRYTPPTTGGSELDEQRRLVQEQQQYIARLEAAANAGNEDAKALLIVHRGSVAAEERTLYRLEMADVPRDERGELESFMREKGVRSPAIAHQLLKGNRYSSLADENARLKRELDEAKTTKTKPKPADTRIQGEPAAARKKDDGTETLSLAEYNERMRDPRQVHKTIAARKAGTLKIKL